MTTLAAIGIAQTAVAEEGEHQAKPLATTLPTTRAYVAPEWEVEFEQWYEAEVPRKGATEHLFREEVEVGLPYRLHAAVYEDWEINEHHTTRHKGVDFELRWAPFEWGKVPLNPTIYGEWLWRDEAPDKYEVRLLLAEDITPKLFWALNLIHEAEVSGSREIEYAWSQALLYKLIEKKLSGGVEMKFEHATESGSRSDPALEFVVGPSLQWKCLPRTKLKVASLFGTTGDSPRVEAQAILSVELWEPEGH